MGRAMLRKAGAEVLRNRASYQRRSLGPTGGIQPCHFWEISYEYYGWAVMPELLLVGGASIANLNRDSYNVMGGDFEPGFINAMMEEKNK